MLHPVQRAFVDVGAMQCGFCTPGMVVAAVALLDAHPHPSDDEITRWMAPERMPVLHLSAHRGGRSGRRATTARLVRTPRRA